MFGHNDEQHDQKGPTPDDTLAHDENAATALPPVDHPMGASDDAAVVSTNADDSSDFIMTDPPVAPTAPVAEPTTVVPTAPVQPQAADADELLSIKQQALQQLSPLVGHLDQSPEEKFRTTMMLIQAADNDKLIPQAYQAAQAITNEKARAQALLDVVNEINYFTQQQLQDS